MVFLPKFPGFTKVHVHYIRMLVYMNNLDTKISLKCQDPKNNLRESQGSSPVEFFNYQKLILPDSFIRNVKDTI